MPDDDFLYQFQEPLPEDFKQRLYTRLKQITNHHNTPTALKNTVPLYRRSPRRRRAVFVLSMLTLSAAAIALVLGVIALLDFNIIHQEGVLDATSLPDGKAPLHLGDGSIDWIAWSPDGLHLAAAGSRKVWVYDDTLKLLATWEAGTRASALAFGEGVLAVGGYDGTVHLWDPGGAEIASFQAHTGAVSALAFAPGAEWLASVGDDSAVAIWSVETGAEIDRDGTRGGASFNALTFSPTGDVVAAGDEEGVTWVWQIDAEGHLGELIVPNPGSQAGIYMTLAFSPDGERLATGANNKLTVSDLPRRRAEFDHLWAEHPHIMALSSTDNGWFIALGNAYAPVINSLFLVDSSGGKVHIPLPDGNYTQVALNQTRLAAITDDHTLVLWDIGEDGTLSEISKHRAGTGFFFSADMSNGLIAASTQREIWLFDAATGEALQTWTFTSPPPWFYAVDFSPDGKKLVVQAYATLDYPPESYEYFVVDLTALEDAVTHQSFPDIPSSDIAFHPDGTRLASGGETIHFWEIGDTGLVETAEWSPTAAGGNITRLAFSPDGTLLAGWVRNDGKRNWHVYIWVLASGQQVFEILGPDQSAALFAGFTPDGAQIITTSVGDVPAVHFWEIETGKRALTLPHSEPVFDAAFSLDGAHLAMAAADGVWLWDDLNAEASPQKLLDASAAHVHFDGAYLMIQLHDGTMVVLQNK